MLKKPKNTQKSKRQYIKRKPGEKVNYHKPKVVKLADGSEVKEAYHNQYMSVPKYGAPTDDVELGPEPKDEIAKHRFPPPKKNPIFRAKWAKFIDNVVGREKFKEAHLDALEVLCDLYVEYEALSAFIRVHGRSYKCVSRFGETWKFYPEVGQLTKVKGEIRSYTMRLDLFPKKDHGEGSGGKEDDWE